MKPKSRIFGFLAALCLFAVGPSAYADEGRQTLDKADQTYLIRLAKDTWNCIGQMAAPKTDLPYDNADRNEFTSVSNIGIYISCVAAAKHLGYITRSEGDARLEKAVSSLEALKIWHGFQQSWNSVETLAPSPNDTWVSALDSGNLAAGFLTVAEADPKLAGRCRKLFHAMDWSFFYDTQQHALIGGYNTKTGQLNPKWHLDLLGSDAMLAQFFAVAAGNAPAKLWDTFNRATETKYGSTYLQPGWQGGGLFMQYISGLWLDLHGTEMGRSAKSFAAAQIQHAKEIKSPVWGWSASDNPGGSYLGWGALKDEVITPHASVLAIEHFPQEVVDNLRALEKLGARSPDRGFYDAVNVKTGKRSKQFLVLDQGMLFLSLANFLDHDLVRRWFQRDTVVRTGRARIALLKPDNR